MAYFGPLPYATRIGGTGTNVLSPGVLIGRGGEDPPFTAPYNEFSTLVTDAAGIPIGADPGTRTQVLISNGTVTPPSFGRTGGAFAFLQSYTVTSPVATINFEILPIFSIYLLYYYNWGTSVGASMRIQFSDDGGGTYPAGGFLSGGLAYLYNTVSSPRQWSGATSSFPIVVANAVSGPGPRYHGGGYVYMLGLNQQIMGSIQTTNVDVGLPATGFGGGKKALSNINAFQIFSPTVGATFTSGKFVLYGIRETTNPN